MTNFSNLGKRKGKSALINVTNGRAIMMVTMVIKRVLPLLPFYFILLKFMSGTPNESLYPISGKFIAWKLGDHMTLTT